MAASAATGAGRAAKLCGTALICVAGVGAGVVVVDGNHGVAHKSAPASVAHSRPKAAPAPVRAATRHAVVVKPSHGGAARRPPPKKADGSRKVKKQRQVVTDEAPAAITESVPAHPSQPPPSEVISTLEETNRPTSGTVEAHPSTGADGSEVAEVEKAGGKTGAIESLEAGRP